jgi:hypothetical protein
MSRNPTTLCAKLADGAGDRCLELLLRHGGGLARPIGEVLVDAGLGKRDLGNREIFFPVFCWAPG